MVAGFVPLGRTLCWVTAFAYLSLEFPVPIRTDGESRYAPFSITKKTNRMVKICQIKSPFLMDKYDKYHMKSLFLMDKMDKSVNSHNIPIFHGFNLSLAGAKIAGSVGLGGAARLKRLRWPPHLSQAPHISSPVGHPSFPSQMLRLWSIWGFHGVSITGGTPIAGWFIMETPIKMDDDWGYPNFRKPPYLPT